MTDIRHTSDNTRLNNDNRTTAENWSYTRHLSKLADQAKQQTDLVPSSPRDTNSAPSSLQDRGKRPLTAKELLEEEWRKVEPGENGKPPEKLVIPDSGLKGGMWKNWFEASTSRGSNLSRDAKEEFKREYSEVKDLLKEHKCNLTKHEMTITTAHATIYSLLGKNKYKESKEVYEYYFPKSVQWFGMDGEWNMSFLGDLINTYVNKGRSEDIADLLVNSFRNLEQKDHSKITSTLDYLIDRSQNELKDNFNYCKCVFSIYESMLGPNHSKTLDALDNVARQRLVPGKYGEATELYMRLVANVGIDHPKSAQLLDSLLDEAKGLRYSWYSREVVDIYRVVIPHCEQRFGPNGSKTLDAMGGMCMAYMKGGDYEKGAEVYEHLVARIGRDHPKSAQVLDSLLDEAGARLSNDVWWASDMYRVVVPICERQFGPNDPKTLDAMGDMFMAYMKGAKYEKGAEVYEHLVARAGRDHPKIAQALDSLLDEAKARLSKIRYKKSVDIYEGAIPIYERQFGPNDPRTVEFRSVSDNCCKALGWGETKSCYSINSSGRSLFDRKIINGQLYERDWASFARGYDTWNPVMYDSNGNYITRGDNCVDYIHSDDEGDGGDGGE
jgi:hypothetical protein